MVAGSKEISEPSNVIQIHSWPQTFSLIEARTLLPLVRKLTNKWHARADKVLVAFHYSTDQRRRAELEKEFNGILDSWAEAIERLGPTVKGPWLVDFDTGDGNYWCWQHPEKELLYTHSHEGGFHTRHLISPQET